MHKPHIKHTLNIFSHLVNRIPPLAPKNMVADAKQAYKQMESNFDLELGEMEKTIIFFGKKLWPYRQAFKEFFNVFENKLGESFLLGKLEPNLKRRYKEFVGYGGNFVDLYSGNPAMFFDVEDRVKVGEALVDVKRDIWGHTAQAVFASSRIEYEKKVARFQIILDDIEKRLNVLSAMADDEQEYPNLAEEIRGQVLAFEYGLCLLGPPYHYDSICQTVEHFVGRKHDYKMRNFV